VGTLIHNRTSTSIAAAESMTGSAAGDRARILDAIRAAGIHGLTRDEISDRTGISGDTVRPRVRELLDSKPPPIEEAGEIRRTASGRAAKVLTVKGAA
jgi:hypothetical protein